MNRHQSSRAQVHERVSRNAGTMSAPTGTHPFPYAAACVPTTWDLPSGRRRASVPLAVNVGPHRRGGERRPEGPVARGLLHFWGRQSLLLPSCRGPDPARLPGLADADPAPQAGERSLPTDVQLEGLAYRAAAGSAALVAASKTVHRTPRVNVGGLRNCSALYGPVGGNPCLISGLRDTRSQCTLSVGRSSLGRDPGGRTRKFHSEVLPK
jgi:hypothetical protein